MELLGVSALPYPAAIAILRKLQKLPLDVFERGLGSGDIAV